MPPPPLILPQGPKKEAKPVSRTFRMTKLTAERLAKLAKAHNLSQADVVSHLVNESFTLYEQNKKLRKN